MDDHAMDLLREGAASLLEKLDGVCRTVSSQAAFQGLYFSPFWVLESPGGVVGWKRTVLRREPGRGAISLGHIFLVVTSDVNTRPRVEDLPEPSWGLGSLAKRPISAVVLSVGPPAAHLLTRPHRPETEGPLRSFVDALVHEFDRPGTSL